VRKEIKTILETVYEADYPEIPIAAEENAQYLAAAEVPKLIERLRKEMQEAAARLEFERAAELRDQILYYEEQLRQGGDVILAPTGATPLRKGFQPQRAELDRRKSGARRKSAR
jgi:hypothetical protein